MTRIIRVVTAVIRNTEGRLLLVRKRGTHVYMQPGGKIEPGETPREALVRELAEEVSLTVTADALRPLGTFTATAANEPDCVVEAQMFALSDIGPVCAAGEIAEVWWRSDDDRTDRPIAPLTREFVLGAL